MKSPQADTDHLAAILVLVAGIAFAVSPFFTSGFNGFEPDQFPVPQRDSPIQPAGYAFSIWGLIYVWLLVHAVTGLFLRTDDPDWRPTRWPLVISLGIGASWIAVAQISPLYATVQIWVMLVAALVALARAPRMDRWRLQAPLAIYAGWLTAASFVSIGLSAAGYGLLADAEVWGYAALVLALIFALVVQLRLDRAPEYGLTVIWALVGIAVANLGQSVGMVILAALGCLAMAFAAWRAAT